MEELTAQQEDFLLESAREERPCTHVHKDAPEGDKCEDCGKPWNSEYHMSDQCINVSEDCYNG